MERSIVALIAAAEEGDGKAVDELFATLYSELHRLARRQLMRSAGRPAMGTTTLLHEAYLDISSRESARFPDRSRFMAYAAKAMRGLIIDRARSRRAAKRGGPTEDLALDEMLVAGLPDDARLARIGEALDRLASADPLLAQVVDLKFFCGFSFAEIAALWNLSERTVQRHWEKARIYLHGVLAERP